MSIKRFIATLNKDVTAALESPDVKRKLHDLNVDAFVITTANIPKQ